MEHRALSRYVELVRSNTLATYIGLVSAVSGSKVVQDNGYTLVRGPGPFSFCNFAAGFELKGDIEGVIGDLKAQSDGCFGFYVFVMSGDQPDDLQERLLASGFEVRQVLVSMSCETVATNPVEARLVVGVEDRRAVASFMAEQFFWSMPNEAREAIAAATAASGHTLWVVGEPSDPRAAVMLVEGEEVVGLFNLCVKPELRGKGVGAGVVSAVQQAAQSSGRPVVLQCGEELVPWYQSLGFERVGTIKALTVATGGSGDILL